MSNCVYRKLIKSKQIARDPLVSYADCLPTLRRCYLMMPFNRTWRVRFGAVCAFVQYISQNDIRQAHKMSLNLLKIDFSRASSNDFQSLSNSRATAKNMSLLVKKTTRTVSFASLRLANQPEVMLHNFKMQVYVGDEQSVCEGASSFKTHQDK